MFNSSVTGASQAEKSAQLITKLTSKFGDTITSSGVDLGDAVVTIAAASLFNFMVALKTDSELDFNMLLSATAVDFLDARPERFEVVYHLLSLSKLHRLRVKVPVSEDSPEVDSLVELWRSANFMEREAWDMLGIRFKNHPDLRRILMYPEFKGHPLRKDYPVQGKQPRIPLLAPEVENTARNMRRQSLVQIGRFAKPPTPEPKEGDRK